MSEGGCHCGAVRYRLTGAPRRVGLCHCADCRRSAGAPLVGWAAFGQHQFVSTGQTVAYASSEDGRRHFCPRCGTGLFYTNEALFPGEIDLQVATLDDPDSLPPTEQIQVAERIGWMETAHLLPAHDRWPT